ncbi:hypothetical protein DSO57_1000634 [Entomophthora muscae]|uniref:Uncharacterized protein n=1 Tax=Entomophthora muscae TaxID=34485 RepID=A0ACC2S0L8_9FUNG|nr:hypothetical protein DSO57_1000634 [Entomophthora muscae]
MRYYREEAVESDASSSFTEVDEMEAMTSYQFASRLIDSSVARCNENIKRHPSIASLSTAQFAFLCLGGFEYFSQYIKSPRGRHGKFSALEVATIQMMLIIVIFVASWFLLINAWLIISYDCYRNMDSEPEPTPIHSY